MNNLEGWLNEIYIRLYDSTSYELINIGYESRNYIPGYTIIGSNDHGDALCLCLSSKSLYWIPFVPLNEKFKTFAYRGIEDLKSDIDKNIQVNSSGGDERYGLEVHFVKPLVLGGDPNDNSNVKFTPQVMHQDLCRFWNKFYIDRYGQRGG